MPVKSPYNFVPAPDENAVYNKPDWADQVSHDIPFSDGESGELTLRITAETPIFIRNGHSRKDKDILTKLKNGEIQHPTQEQQQAIDRYLAFSNIAKQYFIPATSLKGMFRGVLEIMSFSRMRQINSHKHSVRQIMRTKGTVMDEGYQLMADNVKKTIECGYLIREEDKYYIYGCGRPFKVRYTDLDENLHTDFGKQFGSQMLSDMNNTFSARTGEFKYVNIIGDDTLEHTFEVHSLDGEGESSWKSKFQPLDYVKFSSVHLKDSFTGRIVCVGQASPYQVDTARKGEYVFKGAKKNVISAGNKLNQLSVSKEVMDTFLFINRDGKGINEELADWRYWKNQITTGIPVFFRRESNRSEVLDLGLTFMYKQPVESSVKESNPLYESPSIEEYKLDLSEIIFGNIYDKGKQKGRVMFSHFKANGTPNLLPEKSALLASPKSSFTPFYLQQNGHNGRVSSFNTYNNNPRLRGFKRYPVHTNNRNPGGEDQSPEMLSYFRPLDRNTVFTGKVRFHNLRKFELGALISSICFHNTPNVYHSLGSLKPLGYGRVKVEILQSNGLIHTIEDYLKEFECEMRASVTNWSTVLKELLTMATLQNNGVENSLEYMDLANFQTIKNSGEFLENYTAIVNGGTNIRQYCTGSDIEQRREQKNAIKVAKQHEIQELEDQFSANRSQKRFSEAIEVLDKLKVLNHDKSYYYDNWKDLLDSDIENFQSYLEEKSAFEELMMASDINPVQEFIKKYPSSEYTAEVRQRELEIRIKIKEEAANELANQSLHFERYDFGSIKSLLNPFLKNKQFEFSPEQRTEIHKALVESHRLEASNRKSDWNKGNYPKYPWSDVVKWLGDDLTKKLFDELNQ